MLMQMSVTPTFLGKCAQAIAKKHKDVKVKVWSKQQIEKAGWGLFLAVSQSSIKTAPVVIEASYTGKSKMFPPYTFSGEGDYF